MASFSFDSWLKNLRSSLYGTRRNTPLSAVRTIRSKRLNLEPLEDRLTPTSLVVTSAGDPATLTAGTLRYEINQANTEAANGISDTITFNTTAMGTDTITLMQGQLELTTPTDITPGTITILDAGGGQVEAVTFTPSNNAAYTTTTTTVTVNVTPAALTISADGESMVYGGSLPALTASYSGLVNGDTPATFNTSPHTAPMISTTATAASHVAGSPYSITASGAVDSDYTISYVGGTLTVTAYAFTYQIANDIKSYGTPANLAHDLGTTINTGVNSQNLDIDYSSTGDTATAPAGTYPITGTLSSGTGLLSDYNVTLLPGTLTVAMSVATGNVYLLNPTASGELPLSGNAQLKLTGVVDVDSSAASALTASGNAIVSASRISVEVVKSMLA